MDRTWKLLLVGTLAAAALSIFQGFRAEARTGGSVGRYQVSAWAHQSVGYNGIIGYVIIDTTNGDVVKRWSGDLKDFRAEEKPSEPE